MKLRGILAAGLLLVGLSIGGYAWMRHIVGPNPQVCEYCLRPLHPNLRVTAEIDGKRSEVCCAQCAITEANQKHKPLKLVTVRDYPSGRPIAPEGVWYVQGSRVTACEHGTTRMNEMRRTQDVAFDRCSPGTFAFANKADAEVFIDQNGGSVVSFPELMRQVQIPLSTDPRLQR